MPIAYPVHAVSGRRVEAAQVLELAARTRLEPCEAGGDAVLDRGVVAHVEVQVAKRVEGPPVAAVERVALLHVERPRDHLAVPSRQHQTDAIAKPLEDALEE